MENTEEWEIIRSLLEQQDYSTCIVQLERQLSEKPQDPIYLYWLAYSFIHINHPLAALETLEQYCIQYPSKVDLKIQSALLIANFDATKFHQAERIAHQGIQDHPKEPLFYRYMALIKSRSNWEEAKPFFEKAHILSPKRHPLPSTTVKPSIFQMAVSWLPSNAKEWITTLNVQFEASPSIEILNQEDFPHHPLIPFLLYDDTIYVFLNNLRYQPQHKSASTALFEQLLELWNDYKNSIDA